MSKKDLILSIGNDTFSNLKNDFDTILNRTIGNMTMKGADEATITLKLDISLEKDSIEVGNRFQDVTKPGFKHTISSVLQVKDKMTGQFNGEYGMVWDEDGERWVLRKIDNGQMNMFDDDEDIVDVSDAVDVERNNYQALPASTEKETVTQNDEETPFDWLCQFIGDSLHITESMGNYTVRTDKNKVVLSSATSKDSPFYCPESVLESHVGHNLVCVGYGDETIENVSIECEDCDVVLYDDVEFRPTLSEMIAMLSCSN